MTQRILWLPIMYLCIVLPNNIFGQEIEKTWKLPTHELYRYSISLLGIPAGTGTLQTTHQKTSEGQAQLRLKSTAQSNDFISLFFPVNNLVDSILDTDTLLPHHFVFQRREGNDHEDFEVTFHHDSKDVTIIKNGQRSTMSISSNTHGPLSFLYYVRTLSPLHPGHSHRLQVHHDKKNYELEIKIESVEQVAGPWGKVEAIRCEAVMPFRGIFANQGNFHFWLSNDQRRIPLMMQAKVIVGSVKVLLEDWKR